MSRLKGADLGITSATFRGDWTAAPGSPYLIGDTVVRNGLPYTAVGTPGSTDPANAGALTTSMIATSGPSQGPGSGSGAAGLFDQAFTPTATVDVGAVTWRGRLNSGAGVYAQLKQGSTVLATSATVVPTNGVVTTYTFPLPVTLRAGTAYTISFVATDASTTWSDVISQAGTAMSGATIGAQSLFGAYTFFTLLGRTTTWVPQTPGALPYVENVSTVAASGAAQTIPEPAVATINRITLTANCTLAFPIAVAGKSFTLVLVQDGTGSRTVTWPASVKWAGGVAPALSTGAGKVDYLSFTCTDGSTWAGFFSGRDMR